MKNFYRNTYAKINLAYCRHNVRILKKMAGEKNYFCGMVKANAYGHGDCEIANLLLSEGASALGVALIEEGIRLREAGVQNCTILVFHPQINDDDAQAIIKYELTPVISSWPSLIAFQKAASGKKISIHIKLNTGMNRHGFALSEIQLIHGFIRAQSNLILEGVSTHLLRGEDWGEEFSYTKAQLDEFALAIKIFSEAGIVFHVHNSASLIAGHCHKLFSTHLFGAHMGACNGLGARIGLSLYGIKPEINSKDPQVQELWSTIDLKPVMSIHTETVLLQKVLKGKPISYDAQFICSRDSQIGILPIGYADGFRRQFSNKGKVLCCGHTAPVVGVVCMDSIMIDLTDLQNIMQLKESELLNQEVVLLGSQGGNCIQAEELAKIISTNTYDILTGISARVPRVYT